MKILSYSLGLLGGLFLLAWYLDDNDHNYERTHHGTSH